MFQKIKNLFFGNNKASTKIPESTTCRFLELEGENLVAVATKVYSVIPYMLGQNPETEPINERRFRLMYKWLKSYNPIINRNNHFLEEESDIDLLLKAAFNQPPYFDINN